MGYSEVRLVVPHDLILMAKVLGLALAVGLACWRSRLESGSCSSEMLGSVRKRRPFWSIDVSPGGGQMRRTALRVFRSALSKPLLNELY